MGKHGSNETKHTSTLAFDVYGTLFDVSATRARLQSLIDVDVDTFSSMWRQKQLEYTFRRAAMNAYEEFSICTEQALRFTCLSLEQKFDDASLRRMMKVYQDLPLFEDVRPCLQALTTEGHEIYAFSNGLRANVEDLLESASVASFFVGVVSVDDVKTFKPDPRCYRYFLESTNSGAESAWLVSANAFDIIGAAETGMQTVLVNRNESALLDPWEIEPRLTVRALDALPKLL